MTDSFETFQIPLEAAEFYESAFVPAFFAQWAPVLCSAAGVLPGQSVLDVACGTGIVARTAAPLVGARGTVTGVDLNEAMLTVARRVSPAIDWHQGDVAALPFPEQSFDIVLSQMALMFFLDPVVALHEMRRVVRPGGTLAVLVPGQLEHQAAFSPFVAMAASHAGPQAASVLASYFACGDLDRLSERVTEAGLAVTISRVEVGTYRAPSVEAFVTTEVESTPLIDKISDDVYGRIKRDAYEVLGPFTAADGSVSAPFESNLVVAERQ